MIGHVAVVGGGLAGIAAALDCAAGGARVTLLEVRDRLGGAAYSFERDGLRLDNGQHVFLRCCSEYTALLDQLGSRELTTLQARFDVPVVAPGGKVARLRRSSLPAPLHLAPALARYAHLPLVDRARAMRAAVAIRRLDARDPVLDQLTFHEWLDSHGQRRAGIEALWELFARPTMNLPVAQASLAQAVQVFRTGLLDRSDAGDIGWARVPLSDVHDAPARRALRAAGVDIRLRWRAQRIAQREPSGWAVEGSRERVDADAVILAAPHDRIAALLPRGSLATQARLAALGSSPIVNLHIVYDRPVMPMAIAAAVRSPVQWVFDRTRSSGLRSGQLLSVSLSAAEEEMGAREMLRARYLPALAELFPAAATARVERFIVVREHAATFRAVPGTAALRPGAQTLHPDLFLAGAYTATGWPATMEGAVRSGRTAAQRALAALTARPVWPGAPLTEHRADGSRA